MRCPSLITLAAIWSLTLLNCAGARIAGGFQALTTLVKLLPLAAILVVAGVALAHSGSGAGIAISHQRYSFWRNH